MQITPFKGASITKRLLLDVPARQEIYDPLGSFERAKLVRLMDFVKDDKAKDTSGDALLFYKQLITPKSMWPKKDKQYGWLSTDHMSHIMHMFTKRSVKEVPPFRSTRIAFLDPMITSYWCKEYKQHYVGKENKWDFASGYKDIFRGETYSYKTNRQWVKDVDTLYIAHNVGEAHWVALEVQLQQKRIKVFDSYTSCYSDKQIEDSCKPFAKFVPLLIERMQAPRQGRVYQRKNTCKSYVTYRTKGTPQQGNAGDCGVYCLKFIECLALGCKFDGITDENMPFIRLKFAAEAFDEVGTPIL